MSTAVCHVRGLRPVGLAFGIAAAQALTSTSAHAYGAGVSLAPAAALSLQPRVSVVARSTVLFQFARDHGLIAALEQEAGGMVGVTPPDRWSVNLWAGYGWQPLPHLPRVGFELAGRLSAGRFPFGDHGRFGYGLGPHFAMPIRAWSARKPLWDSEAFLEPLMLVVPSLDGTFYARHAGLSKEQGFELSIGLALRGYLWSSLVP
jgi:hypothetical protein